VTNQSRRTLAWKATALVSALAVLGLGAVSCARQPAPPPAAPPTMIQPAEPSATTTTASEPTPTTPTTLPNPRPNRQTPVRVYLVRGEHLGVGTARYASPSSPAFTAVSRLLEGPTAADKKMGLSTEIPRGARVLGVSISDGTATVNLSEKFESGGGTLSMTLRVAQVVDTLTQFKTVKRVAFKIDGKKVESIGGEGIVVAPSVDREDFESAQPAILIEKPFPRAIIRSPVQIEGTANVFEAQFTVRVTDAKGSVLAETPVKATSGTGTRGTFSKLVKFKKPKTSTGFITVFEPSAKDGSETNVVQIPVRF
jgi:germination protein M